MTNIQMMQEGLKNLQDNITHPIQSLEDLKALKKQVDTVTKMVQAILKTLPEEQLERISEEFKKLKQ